MMSGDELRTRLEEIREGMFLPEFDDGIELEDIDERYLLLERGHYGRSYLSGHATPQDAGIYALSQEYAEDWAPTCLLDRETEEVLRPFSILWVATDA